MTDWSAWHDDYADPASPLSRRLAFVQSHVRDYLNSVSGPVTITSACAGDGRDVLEVLATRDDASRVTVTLLETDDRNVARAQQRIDEHRLEQVTITTADAGNTSSYADLPPADLLLMCGVMGNITDDDLHTLVQTVPSLGRHGSVVLWTRSRKAPDITPQLREWFVDEGFEEESFTAPNGILQTVGRHRYPADPPPLEPGRQFFTFTR